LSGEGISGISELAFKNTEAIKASQLADYQQLVLSPPTLEKHIFPDLLPADWR
jgi:hypothetical protein